MLPSPATACWSSSTAFNGARRRRRAAASSARPSERASGPSRSTSGSRLTLGESARIVQTEAPTAAEPERPPVPPRMIVTAAVGELTDRAHVVEQDAAGHAEVDADRGAIGEHDELLAAAIEPGDRGPDRHRVDALGHHERVGAIDARYRVADQVEQSTAGQLDFEDLRHRTAVSQARPSDPASGRGTLVDVLAVAILDILGLIGILAVCGGLLYLANRIEPHWVAKDGQRFMTVAQDLDQFGLPTGRKREVRVHLDPDEDALFVRSRSMVRPSSGIWVVHARSPKPPRGGWCTSSRRSAAPATPTR